MWLFNFFLRAFPTLNISWVFCHFFFFRSFIFTCPSSNSLFFLFFFFDICLFSPIMCMNYIYNISKFIIFTWSQYDSFYALVIVGFQVQYDRYFRVSYFPDLIHKPLRKWNSSKIWETRKILAVLYKTNVQ